MAREVKTQVQQNVAVVSAISRLEKAGDQKSVRLLQFLSSAFQEKPEVKFGTLTDVKDFIGQSSQALDAIVTSIVDQVEDQIVELKSSILALNELLPLDPLQQSGVYVFNTTKQNFLSFLQDPDLDTISSTPLGDFIRAIHIHADLVSAKSVNGVFVFFPLGSQDKDIAQEHASALANFTQLAHRHCFEIYFNVDNAQIYGCEKYSELPDEITKWINQYKDSTFFKILTTDVAPYLRRRLCHVFNPYLVDSERLQEKFPQGHPPLESDKELIDKCCWAPPVSLMAKRLIQNYEEMGWCGQLFGIATSIPLSAYTNFNPKEEHTGRSFSAKFHHRYSLALWNFKSDLEFQKLRDTCLITPLQRQCRPDPHDNKRICEEIAFAEAQTMLPVPPSFREITDTEYDKLAGIEKLKYDQDYNQKMFNSLGTALIEDTICRGLILMTRQFIGKTAEQTKEALKQWVDVYMSVFAGKNLDVEPYNTFIPALRGYRITECSVSGQRAFVTVQILPNEFIRNIQLGVYLSPSHLFYRKEGGGGEGGRKE